MTSPTSHRSAPRRTRRRRIALAVPVALALLAASACGGSDSGTGASGGTTTTADLSLLGPADEATDDPLTIGLVADGQSDAMDSTSVMDAGKATVEYANEHLGGINGHPIELETCETGQTPTGAANCAVQMIDAEVAAVVVPSSTQDVALIEGLEGADIPYVTLATANPGIVGNPSAFVLSNPFAAIAAPAALAEERGLEKVGLLVIDVPATTGPITALATPIYEKAGLEFDLINVSAQVADMTPQVQQAINDGNELIVIGGTEQFTINAIKALQQLGFDGDIALAGGASAAGVAEALPGDLEGVDVISPTTSDPEDPDVQLYDAVMATYAPDLEPNGITPNGFAAVLGLVRALTGATDAVDAATIQAALAAMPEPVDLPRGGGTVFQCGAEPIGFAPSVCGADILVGTLDADGVGHDYEAVDVGPYLTPG